MLLTSSLCRLLVVLALPAVAFAAVDEGRSVVWPTYLRTGPGRHFAVMQELGRGDPVELRSCAKTWCEVRVGRVFGFVENVNLGAESPPARYVAPRPDAPGCFDSLRAGTSHPERFRYCPDKPDKPDKQ